MNIRRWLVFGLVATAALPAPAQVKEATATVAEVLAKGAKQMSAGEVNALVPGATIERVTPRGLTQRWSNDAGGGLVVSTLGLPASSGKAVSGKWSIEPDGRYCIDIDWRSGPAEKWCQFVLRGPDGYYLTPNPKSGAAAANRVDIRK